MYKKSYNYIIRHGWNREDDYFCTSILVSPEQNVNKAPSADFGFRQCLASRICKVLGGNPLFFEKAIANYNTGQERKDHIFQEQKAFFRKNYLPHLTQKMR